MVGKVLLANVYFTDLSSYKIRPIIVIKDMKEDILCFPLTTNLSAKGTKICNDDMEYGNLKKTSVVITPKILVLHKSVLLKEIGKIKAKKLIDIKNLLCQEMEC